MSKKKKKIIATISSITILIIAAFIIMKLQASTTDPTLIVSKGVVKAGEEVSVSVSAQNNPGVAGFAMDLEYDSKKLTPVEIIRENSLSQGMFTSNLASKANDEPIRVTWFNVTDMEEDSDLYTIRFRASSSASGKLPISIKYADGNIANQMLEIVNFKVKEGNVKIKR